VFGETRVIPTVMRVGDNSTGGCYYYQFKVIDIATDRATFEIKAGGYCPICWYNNGILMRIRDGNPLTN